MAENLTRARKLRDLKRPGEAEECYLKVLEQDPSNADIWYELTMLMTEDLTRVVYAPMMANNLMLYWKRALLEAGIDGERANRVAAYAKQLENRYQQEDSYRKEHNLVYGDSGNELDEVDTSDFGRIMVSLYYIWQGTEDQWYLQFA